MVLQDELDCKGRIGYGFIAVPAYKGSSAEAKRAPVTQRGSILPSSRFNFLSMSTNPKPAHVAHMGLHGLGKERITQGGLQPDCSADQPVA
eukprot:373039-Pelagomonas_calceolata.AAC.1